MIFYTGFYQIFLKMFKNTLYCVFFTITLFFSIYWWEILQQHYSDKIHVVKPFTNKVFEAVEQSEKGDQINGTSGKIAIGTKSDRKQTNTAKSQNRLQITENLSNRKFVITFSNLQFEYFMLPPSPNPCESKKVKLKIYQSNIFNNCISNYFF